VVIDPFRLKHHSKLEYTGAVLRAFEREAAAHGHAAQAARRWCFRGHHQCARRSKPHFVVMMKDGAIYENVAPK
jgi:hypothetical protein